MSRLARKPIEIPENIEVKIEDGRVAVIGPKGELARNFKNNVINIFSEGRSVFVKPLKENNKKESKVLLGTYTSHIKNMIKGVTDGYEKKLIIEGVGYKAEMRDKNLVLSLGFSHPVNYSIPEGVLVIVEKNTIIVSGTDKDLVGLTASKIRMLKKPEPYKGKGIRYSNEIVKRKAGKKSGS